MARKTFLRTSSSNSRRYHRMTYPMPWYLGDTNACSHSRSYSRPSGCCLGLAIGRSNLQNLSLTYRSSGHTSGSVWRPSS